VKRKLASGLVVIGLLASSMDPASAIFGLSKCEKVKKQIKNELAIGDALFKAYRSSVYKIQPKKVTETYGEHYQKYENALNALTLVFDSDIKAWGMAQKSSQCFSVEQNSAIRTGLRTISSSSTKIDQIIAKKDIFAQYDLTKIYTGRIDINDIFFSKKK
jgi:CII-binding regulator of phage lambda lysogenization HflD